MAVLASFKCLFYLVLLIIPARDTKLEVFKKKYGAKWEFPKGGWGLQTKEPSIGVAWIFPATKHSLFTFRECTS